MNAVFDTNVLAYALFGVQDRAEEALAVLDAATSVLAPDSVWAELVNTAWQYARTGLVDAAIAAEALADARSLLSATMPARDLSADALSLAIAADHPAYDTLFIAVARATGTRVVSYDESLRTRFPDDVVYPAEVLSPDGPP